MTTTATSPSGPTEPGAASCAIASVLRGPEQPVRVLAAFRAAVYLAHDEGVVTLVAADGVHHPNAVVVTARSAAHPFAGLRPRHRGTLGDGGVRLLDRRIAVTRWFDPVPRLAPTDTPTLAGTTAAMRRRLDAVRGPIPEHLRVHTAEVAAALAAVDDRAAVGAAKALLGWGPGLTPAGDDVLAGLMVATLACTRAVHGTAATPVADATRRAGASIAREARDLTTAVSAALLAHAANGAVAAPAAGVLHALTGRGALHPALDRLLAVGSTSGRDLAVGLLAGADLARAVSPDSAPTRPTS